MTALHNISFSQDTNPNQNSSPTQVLGESCTVDRMWNQLHHAIIKEDTEKVGVLLAMGYQPDCKTSVCISTLSQGSEDHFIPKLIVISARHYSPPSGMW